VKHRTETGELDVAREAAEISFERFDADYFLPKGPMEIDCTER
jgi:hypothetical protein